MDSIKIVDTLLVEDNPADARLIQEAIKQFQVEHKINVVEDGIESMEYLHKKGEYKDCETPDLIILDLNLPRKSGREVLKEVKNEDKLMTIPVIILTTSKNEADVCESYKCYANAYMTKPTDFSDFMDAIKNFESFWFNNAVLPKKCNKN